MRRVAPSVVAREQLQRLLGGGVDHEQNIVSALVETVTRLVVQELLEGEQGDFLGGRGRYQRRGEEQLGLRNGYERGRLRTAEGFVDVAVPQVRGAGEPFRSSLMSFLDGNSEVLESLVNEMYARGLSTRDVEDAFRDATGELLISRSKVSEITDRLWEDYQAFIARDLSELEVEYLFVDAVFEALRRHGAKEALLVAWCIDSDGANTCCTWPSATRSPRRVGPSSSAPCSPAGCGCRPPSPATARPGWSRRSGLFPRLDPDPVLVPPAGQHPRQAARRVGLGGNGAPVCGARRPDARRGPRRRGPADQHLRSSVPGCGPLPDDLDALLAIHRVPVRHRIRVRTTNLAERSFVEERRRTKVIGRFGDEHAAMKLVFATMIRAAERWCRVSISDLERHQLKLLRAELGIDPPPASNTTKTNQRKRVPHDQPGHRFTGR